MVAAAAYLFAASGSPVLVTFLAVIAGTIGIVASGCVVNNYIDRSIDKAMKRTQNRALVTGEISAKNALGFAAFLGIIGSLILLLYVNALTLIIGLLGFFFYVVVYGVAKRKSLHSTLVGTISGATPPIAGYTAAASQIDTAAILLFLILVIWQMPHFYAIAMFRKKEYQAANIPLLSVVKGMSTTKRQTTLYIIAFILIAPLLTLFAGASITYSIIMLSVGLWWLKVAFTKQATDEIWAKKIFVFSLLVLVIFSILLAADSFLP